MVERQQRAIALSRIGKMLHVHYDSVAEAPLPGRWLELVGLLEQQVHARNLSQADRHIADGKRQIAEQRNRVTRMRARGVDTAEAERLLDRFEHVLKEMLRHRAVIVDRMGRGP